MIASFLLTFLNEVLRWNKQIKNKCIFTKEVQNAKMSEMQ